MKHNTKPVNGTAQASKKRMIGLRLDESEMQLIEQFARQEHRSLAQMARIFLRRGMGDSHDHRAHSKG